MRRPCRPFFARFFASAVAALWLAGCVHLPPAPPPEAVTPPAKPAEAPSGPYFTKLLPEQFPAFNDDLPKETLSRAIDRSLAYLKSASFRLHQIGGASYSRDFLIESLEDFKRLWKSAPDEKSFLESLRRNFDVYQSTGSDNAGKVVFSSYYEPTLPARDKPDAKFKFPLYARPPDMVDIQLKDFNPKWEDEKIIGRVSGNKVSPYFTREEIDLDKALAGRNLELAWLSSNFDRLSLHIQGSGRLVFAGGVEKRAQFAATNNYPYRSVGLILIETGAMNRDEVTHERVRQYFEDHPEAGEWVIAKNKRYTFFEIKDIEPDSEPLGTIRQQLTPGRSIAFDPQVAPLGILAFMETLIPSAAENGKLLGVIPAARFVVLQDTGGAIKGPGRVDLFAGHGPQAHTLATNLWYPGRLFLVIKKLPAPAR
ncbi:MAG: MltA domain-containing protein [Elusimicrobia bacterium]|nr:MltA domain-containing protein [Elusimicrobiota bacterium]